MDNTVRLLKVLAHSCVDRQSDLQSTELKAAGVATREFITMLATRQMFLADLATVFSTAAKKIQNDIM